MQSLTSDTGRKITSNREREEEARVWGSAAGRRRKLIPANSTRDRAFRVKAVAVVNIKLLSREAGAGGRRGER